MCRCQLNYGPFQGACRTNLQLLIDERIHQEKSTSLWPWIVGLVVFGGMDPETGLIVGSGSETTMFFHGIFLRRNYVYMSTYVRKKSGDVSKPGLIS